MPSEIEYKREFRKLVGVWSEAYETSRGSGLGYPDLQLLVDHLVPVELKVGRIGSGWLHSSEIRPTQITWHHDFLMAGGTAFILVCCGPVKTMDAWVIPSGHRDVTSKWKKGWDLRECRLWVKSGQLTTSLSSLVAARTAKGS